MLILYRQPLLQGKGYGGFLELHLLESFYIRGFPKPPGPTYRQRHSHSLFKAGFIHFERARGPMIHLHIAGPGPERPSIIMLAVVVPASLQTKPQQACSPERGKL